VATERAAAQVTVSVPRVAPHKAVEFKYVDDVTGVRRRECRACGQPIEGAGAGLRHVGEVAVTESPDPKYGESLARAQGLLEAVGLTAAQARDAALRLYADGLLKMRRSTPDR
jgi:hypothetical protein